MIGVERFPFDSRFLSDATINCKEPIIFHYTNGAGALGILSTGMLWCTLAAHMNDRQECRYAHQVAIERAYQALTHADDALRTKFMEEFKSQIERISRIKIYVACFSEADDLLSQWRGYSGFNGYAMGFSLENLKRLCPQQLFEIVDVKYKNDQHKKEIDPIISSLLARYDSSLDTSADRGKIDDIFWPSMEELAKKSATIKHPAFAEEREWRLFSHPFANSYDRNEFIIRKEQIVPILKFKLEGGTKDAGANRIKKNICFRTFRVGPGADQEERNEAILAVLQRHNVYWHLGGRSNVPLRS